MIPNKRGELLTQLLKKIEETSPEQIENVFLLHLLNCDEGEASSWRDKLQSYVWSVIRDLKGLPT